MEAITEEQKQLVADNMGLVGTVLVKYMKIPISHRNYDDYFQEGCIGLLLASQRFDPSLGFAFSTFAVPTIKGFIQRYRRDRMNIIKIPRDVYSDLASIVLLINKGLNDDEIMKELNLEPVDFYELRSKTNLASIDFSVPGNDSSSASVSDLIPDKRNQYDELCMIESLNSAAEVAVRKQKNEDKRGICKEWYKNQINGIQKPQSYYGEKYGYSQVQTSRILNKFKNDIKAEMDK